MESEGEMSSGSSGGADVLHQWEAYLPGGKKIIVYAANSEGAREVVERYSGEEPKMLRLMPKKAR